MLVYYSCNNFKKLYRRKMWLPPPKAIRFFFFLIKAPRTQYYAEPKGPILFME